MSGTTSQKEELATSQDEILVYQMDDGQVKFDVRLENETVWLTEQLIAELFQTSVPTIYMHLRHVYEEGELAPEATHKNSCQFARMVLDRFKEILILFLQPRHDYLRRLPGKKPDLHSLAHLGYPVARGIYC